MPDSIGSPGSGGPLGPNGGVGGTGPGSPTSSPGGVPTISTPSTIMWKDLPSIGSLSDAAFDALLTSSITFIDHDDDQKVDQFRISDGTSEGGVKFNATGTIETATYLANESASYNPETLKIQVNGVSDGQFTSVTFTNNNGHSLTLKPSEAMDADKLDISTSVTGEATSNPEAIHSASASDPWTSLTSINSAMSGSNPINVVQFVLQLMDRDGDGKADAVRVSAGGLGYVEYNSDGSVAAVQSDVDDGWNPLGAHITFNGLSGGEFDSATFTNSAGDSVTLSGLGKYTSVVYDRPAPTTSQLLQNKVVFIDPVGEGAYRYLKISDGGSGYVTFNADKSIYEDHRTLDSKWDPTKIDWSYYNENAGSFHAIQVKENGTTTLIAASSNDAGTKSGYGHQASVSAWLDAKNFTFVDTNGDKIFDQVKIFDGTSGYATYKFDSAAPLHPILVSNTSTSAALWDPTKISFSNFDPGGDTDPGEYGALMYRNDGFRLLHVADGLGGTISLAPASSTGDAKILVSSLSLASLDGQMHLVGSNGNIRAAGAGLPSMPENYAISGAIISLSDGGTGHWLSQPLAGNYYVGENDAVWDPSSFQARVIVTERPVDPTELPTMYGAELIDSTGMVGLFDASGHLVSSHSLFPTHPGIYDAGIYDRPAPTTSQLLQNKVTFLDPTGEGAYRYLKISDGGSGYVTFNADKSIYQDHRTLDSKWDPTKIDWSYYNENAGSFHAIQVKENGTTTLIAASSNDAATNAGYGHQASVSAWLDAKNFTFVDTNGDKIFDQVKIFDGTSGYATYKFDSEDPLHPILVSNTSTSAAQWDPTKISFSNFAPGGDRDPGEYGALMYRNDGFRLLHVADGLGGTISLAPASSTGDAKILDNSLSLADLDGQIHLDVPSMSLAPLPHDVVYATPIISLSDGGTGHWFSQPAAGNYYVGENNAVWDPSSFQARVIVTEKLIDNTDLPTMYGAEVTDSTGMVGLFDASGHLVSSHSLFPTHPDKLLG